MKALKAGLLILWACATISAQASEPANTLPVPPDVMAPGAKIAFIYVVFPDDLPVGVYPTQAFADSVGIGLANHLRNQSGGRFDMQATTILNPNHPNGWWVADHSAVTYKSYGSVQDIQRYEGIHWGADVPGGAGTQWPYLGELQAEVLHKVNLAYLGQSNPFTDAALINFVYHGDAIALPELEIDGLGENAAVESTFGFLGVMRQDFMSVCVPGVQQEDRNLASNTNKSVWDLRWIVSHETGHMFFSSSHAPHYGCEEDAYRLSPTQR